MTDEETLATKKLTRKKLDEYLLAKPYVRLDYPFGEEAGVYKVNITPLKKSAGKNSEPDEKMFALVNENKTPINISLKCDPELSKVLREQYESVMPGYHLNKKHWNTLVLSGQLDDQEVLDLIDLSYRLVTEG